MKNFKDLREAQRGYGGSIPGPCGAGMQAGDTKTGDKISKALSDIDAKAAESSHLAGMMAMSKKRAEAKKVTEDLDLIEKAPPGAKYERMVKDIKKSESKDGHLSGKEKAIAYATAWKAKDKAVSEEKEVHRIKYEPKTKTWHHSKNGGFTWRTVSPEEAKKIHPAKFASLSEAYLDENVYKAMAAANKARIKAEKDAAAAAKAKEPKPKSHAQRVNDMHKELARHIEAEVGNHYPDSDGTHVLYPKVDALKRKHGLTYSQHNYNHDHLDAAAKKHLGAKSFSHYLDNFHHDAQSSSVREDIENLEELSKKTLGSYIQKNADATWDNGFKAGNAQIKHHENPYWNKSIAPHPISTDEFEKRSGIHKQAVAKNRKRRAGLGLAIKKLTKEETGYKDEASDSKSS